MDAWGNHYATHPRAPAPARSFSGDNMSRTTPRKPLISFARSASLAAGVPARGLPTPPPLPPLPPGLLNGQESDFRYSPDVRPHTGYSPEVRPHTGYSTPRRPLFSFTSSHHSATNDLSRSPPLPPKPLSRFISFGKNVNNSSQDSSRSNSPPPPAVPPRPVTSHGAQSSLPIRSLPPTVPFRPHLINSPVSDHNENSWSAISPQITNGPAWLVTSPVFATPPPPYQSNFLKLSPKRPHTALPSQPSYPNIDLVKPPASHLPPPPLSGSMPVPDGSNDSGPQMDADLEHALHLSLTESKHKFKTQQQEDEEFAKAVAESLALSKGIGLDRNGNNIRLVDSRSGSGASGSRIVNPPAESLRIPNIAGNSYLDMRASPFEKELQTPSSLFLEMDDPGVSSKASETEEEMAVQLQKEETRQMAVDILKREDIARRDAELTRQLQEIARKQEEDLVEREKRDREAAERESEIERSLIQLRRAQEERDAELARIMAKWEERAPSIPVLPPAPQSPPSLPTQSLPFCDEARPSSSQKLLHERALRTSPIVPSPTSSEPSNKTALTALQNSTSGQPESSVSRSHSGSSTIGNESSSSHSIQPPPSGLSRDPSPGRREVSASPGRVPNGGSTADQLADLRGFSYGFIPPNIPASPPQATLPCSPFPDIINLSRTPYPPFHIMAPSWRHLLRLLAGQETRIQAHIDVIADRKEEQELRVVVQFVKLTYTANTWRTIIHLSLDEPFPPTVPASATTRFLNGDTTILPYSYAISDHGRYMTGPNMHIYAIPLSPTSPFPKLPITFPNLALYLQSAMKDSRARKVRHDSFRRLAKIVQSCYPEEVMPVNQEEKKPSRGVGNLIKRVVGRGNNNRKEVTGNEDVFDMITPFRLDQYTTTSSASTSSS